MDISGVTLDGLERAQTAFESAAAKVGNPSSSEDSVNLSSGAVAMIQAQDAYYANIAAAKATDEMTRATIDLIG
jgi:flagellar basal body rod protein FlgC